MSTGTGRLALTDLPAPRGVPLLGNALQLKPQNMHRILEDWAEVHGPLFCLRIGSKRVLVVSDPTLIQQVLRERPDHYRRFAPLEPVFAEMGLAGLSPAEGEKWRRQRRIWIASLNATQIRHFLPRLAEVTGRLRRHWLRAATAGEAVDVHADLMRYTVDATMSFVLGHDPNTLEQEGDVIQQYLQAVFPTIGHRINMPFPYWRYFKLPADRRLDRDLATLRKLVGALIEQARQRLAASPEIAERPSNLIEALLAAQDEDGSHFDDNEVYSNVLIALLAGEDTAAGTLAWSMHFLAQLPDTQQRLRQEVDAVLGAAELWTDPRQGETLRYVEAVTSETLRLKPAAPIMGHTTVRDVELGGVSLPAGTDVFTVFRPAARSNTLFEDAAQFRPERWLTQPPAANVQQPPTPFGGGPRVCPGRGFATTEMKSVLSMLARGFTLVPAAGPGPLGESLGLTMEPVHLRVRLLPRERTEA